jgi:hypothetical protein
MFDVNRRLHLIEIFHRDKMIHVTMVFDNQYIENNANDMNVV